MSNHLLLSASFAKGLFWLAVFTCGIAHLAIVRSVARSARHRRMEIAWAIIPALLLAAVFVMTWRHLSAGA
jgi:heme/copper-type cytochrome/quinol oxidase subunit 2